MITVGMFSYKILPCDTTSPYPEYGGYWYFEAYNFEGTCKVRSIPYPDRATAEKMAESYCTRRTSYFARRN